jgi:hypothetical protein
VRTTFPDPLTDKEKASTHAYILLAHAVLEEQIETTFERHYDRLVGRLVADMVPMETVRLVYAVREWLPKSFEVPYRKRALGELLRTGARKHFVSQIKLNNGIKPDNIEKLASLVGLDWRAFDDRLVNELEDLRTLGVKRGEAGHLSPYTEKSVRLTRQDYPENVREWIHAGRDAVVSISSYLDRIVCDQQPLSLSVD